MKILITLMCVSFYSSASFLIEPYAGINFNGGWSDNDSDSVNQFSGTMYGVRGGIQKLGAMFGIDARQGSW
ncbi:MAG: hypothetical protein KC478_16100, partial [Bacteriovoracaceae bacterium]|nr:hypothetical protein [Bacteriovoracaceae bacterium]